ncbi:hypothetical protein BDV06DRAFT_190406 [Aspergillus oleicola]
MLCCPGGSGAGIISTFLNCLPVAKFWDRAMPGTCLSFEVIWFFNAAMSIATDLILLVLPMPQLSKLRLPRGAKDCALCRLHVGLAVSSHVLEVGFV